MLQQLDTSAMSRRGSPAANDTSRPVDEALAREGEEGAYWRASAFASTLQLQYYEGESGTGWGYEMMRLISGPSLTVDRVSIRLGGDLLQAGG